VAPLGAVERRFARPAAPPAEQYAVTEGAAKAMPYRLTYELQKGEGRHCVSNGEGGRGGG